MAAPTSLPPPGGASAFVTGGTRGIGYAIAERLASDGFAVTACGTSAEGVAECEAASKAANVAITPRQVDVCDSEALTDAIGQSAGERGLDVLVCCAGRPTIGNALDLSPADWDRCLDLNLRACFVAAHAALPGMVAKRGGVIVFVSSIWAQTTGPERAAYVTAKTALTGLARSIAVDHAAQGIRANCVAPGYVDTNLLRRSLARNHAEVSEALDSIRRAHPLGRLVMPEEIAGAVSFLVGHDARSITGQTLVIDGGVSIRFALPG